jgi:hypothetical protein
MTIKDKPDQQNNAENERWNMIFDGVVSREGAWAGVWINPPNQVQKFVLINFLLIAQITWMNMRH